MYIRIYKIFCHSLQGEGTDVQDTYFLQKGTLDPQTDDEAGRQTTCATDTQNKSIDGSTSQVNLISKYYMYAQ